MIDLALKSEIETIKTIEPGVPGDFVSTLSPYALLLVESWLVRRKVFKEDPGMTLKKELDFLTLVPIGSIHIEMDEVASECSAHMLQDLEKSLPVSLDCAYESLSAQERRHPSRQIETLPMLAGGRHFEAFPLLGPTSAQPGMKAKPSFILKDDGFIGFELGEFFLTPRENGPLPLPVPEDRHSQPFSNCTPADASNIEPVVSSASLRNSSSSEPRVSVHPKQLAPGRTRGGTSQDPPAVASLTRVSTGPDGRGEVWLSAPGFHLDSQHESISPVSCDLYPVKRLAVPDAGPPIPAATQRSSTRSMPPEPASQGPADSLLLPRGESILMPSCNEYSMI
jgi:hypothetical protein